MIKTAERPLIFLVFTAVLFFIAACGTAKPSRIYKPGEYKPGVTKLDKAVTFIFEAPTQFATNVAITGDFNNWNRFGIPMTRINDWLWTVTLTLEYGIFQYNYLLDGKVVIDPYAEAYAPDGKGGKNSIVEVKK